MMQMLKNPQEIEIGHWCYECGSYTTARPLISAFTILFDYVVCNPNLPGGPYCFRSEEKFKKKQIEYDMAPKDHA